MFVTVPMVVYNMRCFGVIFTTMSFVKMVLTAVLLYNYTGTFSGLA